ncbi:hypothetical protein ACGFNU_21120 [Spirillospora sp. NPDC048911]|uniref:hypothetical protein n=1 Tax=Spirillospora sp. NPDC048911 TaxID=3364527 RepID=UPI0037236460
MDSWPLSMQLAPTALQKTADRLVAVDCALKLTPTTETTSSYDTSRITRYAGKFENWLADAKSSQDSGLRRLLLLLVCTKASEGASADRVLTMAKDLHRYATRR